MCKQPNFLKLHLITCQCLLSKLGHILRLFLHFFLVQKYGEIALLIQEALVPSEHNEHGNKFADGIVPKTARTHTKLLTKFALNLQIILLLLAHLAVIPSTDVLPIYYR
jgi:hypothetical protein